jgi:hypothetical protein
MPTAPYLNDTDRDKALQSPIDRGDRALYLTGDPDGYSDADTLKGNTDGSGTAGKKLGERNLSAVGFGGPQDGDSEGRKITLLKAGFVADVDGRTSNNSGCTRIAIVDDGAQEIVLMYVLETSGGSPLDVIMGRAYNNLDTDLTAKDLT